MEQKLQERLAVLETLIRELTKNHRESSKRLNLSIKDLTAHVNDELKGHQRRLQKLEINKATSALKWSILKGATCFFGGAFISLLIALIVG